MFGPSWGGGNIVRVLLLLLVVEVVEVVACVCVFDVHLVVMVSGAGTCQPVTRSNIRSVSAT